MKILVTGATGKIGSRLVPRLLGWGYEVRVLVRRPELAQPLKGAEIARGDLLKPDTLPEALGGIDAVVHLAALFRGAAPEDAIAVNRDGTIALARAAIEAGVPRFIFTSTNLVYGPGGDRPSREDDPVQPGHAYPSSKVEAESILIDLYRTEGLGLRILRLSFVYGEEDPHLRDALMWFRNWHPDQKVQLLHHADVAQAVRLAIAHPEAEGRIYNVGDAGPASAGDILRLLGEPIADEAYDRPLRDPWSGIVDTTRIRTELGFEPIYPSLRHAAEAGVL